MAQHMIFRKAAGEMPEITGMQTGCPGWKAGLFTLMATNIKSDFRLVARGAGMAYIERAVASVLKKEYPIVNACC